MEFINNTGERIKEGAPMGVAFDGNLVVGHDVRPSDRYFAVDVIPKGSKCVIRNGVLRLAENDVKDTLTVDLFLSGTDEPFVCESQEVLCLGDVEYVRIEYMNEWKKKCLDANEALIRERVKIGKVTEKGIEIEGGIVVSGTVQNVDIGNLRHGENIYLSPDVPGGVVGDMQMVKSLLATMSPEKRLELGYADPEQVKTMKDKIRRLHNEIDDLNETLSYERD